ncbi:putative HLH DNA binding domain protein [Fusarium austroafricanum]|uniref:Putative HLH DNA binding domain protein n=1 Tax=Fusarium austroafricanum TaxID=2364996 RepID=A0A8H4KJ14_9HYPO|nr:putative HLH DNA binding domain protein [Fusarium austroafricanum]
MPRARSNRSLSASRPRGRAELAASLQALLANDHVDLEILKPGAPWPSATEIAQLPADSDSNNNLEPVIVCAPEEPELVDPALYTDPFPTNIELEPDWLSKLMDSSQGCEVPELVSCPTAESISTGPSTLSACNTDYVSHFSSNSMIQWDTLLDSMCSPAPHSGHTAESQDRETEEQPRKSVDSSVSEQLSPRKRQRPHYAIEKRYRAGLQERFEALRDCVSSLKQTQQELIEGDDGFRNSDADKAGRMNKAEVLNQATVYIQQLQEENEVALEHVKLLIGQLRIIKRAMRQALGQI